MENKQTKEENVKKPRMNVVVIGHVDSGKSTTSGHLLYKLGTFNNNQVSKVKKIAEEKSKSSFAFAFLFDNLKEEQDRGITINCNLKEFETKKLHYTLIDAPGHQGFIKNMIKGTSQADIAILIVAAPEREFAKGLGEEGSTQTHLILAYTLGIKRLIVCVNKMDTKTVNYNQKQFKNVKSEIKRVVKGIGYKKKNVQYIPISGYTGENLTERSENMKWYTGPTLEDILDNIKPMKRPIEKPLRIPVGGVYKIKGVGVVACGKVEYGVCKPNLKVHFTKSGRIGMVKSIEMHNKPFQQALPGDNVGLNIRDVPYKKIKKGDVISDIENNPAKNCKSFQAQVMILDHPGEIKVGYCPVVFVHTASVSCRISKIIGKLDSTTGELGEEDPKCIVKGDTAVVEFTPLKPLCVETYKDFPALGRLIIRDINKTVGVGVINSVVFEEEVNGKDKKKDKKKK